MELMNILYPKSTTLYPLRPCELLLDYGSYVKKAEVQKITHHLWFDKKAEASIFKNSKIVDTPHYEELAVGASGRLKGTVMTVTFEVEGQRFMALNRGSVIKFSPAISFFVNCETQEEVNDLWEKEIAPNNRNPILFND